MGYGDPPSARLDGGRLHYLEGPLPLRNTRKEQRLLGQLQEKLGMHPGKAERYYGMGAVQMAERLRDCGLGAVEGDGLAACFVTTELSPVFDTAMGALGFG